MLRLRDVGKRYGARVVLREVSLSLPPGSVTLLTGPNGSGKSTLLRIAAGLSRPNSGLVEHAPPPGRIGYLGHQTLLYPSLSALENLRFWAGLHRLSVSEDTLLNSLECMGLISFALEPARAFSRGMAQRLSLARLFLLSPRLILLDEPETGLDDASRILLQREIGTARDSGAAVFWVTHAPDQDSVLADAVLLLEKTRLRVLHAYRPEAAPEAVPCC